jgi:hypothetical protein
MSAPPIPYVWTTDVYPEGAFVPRPAFARRAAEAFGAGEVVVLAPHEPRSKRSHDHFFAVVHEAWLNLPELGAHRFPTEDHLRKFALIRTGWRDERSIYIGSKAAAGRVAAFIRQYDDFAIVDASGPTITVWTAKSQTLKAMGPRDFQTSKTDVIEWLAKALKVTPEALAKRGDDYVSRETEGRP